MPDIVSRHIATDHLRDITVHHLSGDPDDQVVAAAEMAVQHRPRYTGASGYLRHRDVEPPLCETLLRGLQKGAPCLFRRVAAARGSTTWPSDGVILSAHSQHYIDIKTDLSIIYGMSTATVTYRAPAALNRIQWRTEAAALCRIYGFTFNHEALFELFMAVIGPTMARGFEQVAASPEGQRLLREKPDLLALLSDDDYRASLPAGSLGAAYRNFLQQNRLDAGVFDARTVIQPIIDRNQWGEDFGYMIYRGTVLHDVFHVLGGYGPDAGGELGNLGFTHGQLPNCRLTAAMGGIFCAIMGGAGWRRKRQYWSEAVARGRSAVNLMAVHFEELLAEPLAEVRTKLNIAPTEVAHPHGHFFTRWQLPLIHQQVPYEPWQYEPALVEKAS